MALELEFCAPFAAKDALPKDPSCPCVRVESGAKWMIMKPGSRLLAKLNSLALGSVILCSFSLHAAKFVYAGKVDHGFDTASVKDLQDRLKPLIRKTQPYTKKIAHRGIWVEPKLLAEIEYRAKSVEGKVRHPFFKGIREDL